MDRMIITLSIALVICGILLFVFRYNMQSGNAAAPVSETEKETDVDGTVIANVDVPDSDSDSDDEDKKMIEEFSARDAMTITERPKQIDLKTTLKLNGIMTDEVIDLHQMIIGLKPTVWMSANNWKVNTWFDMSGNGNNITQHNGITKRENPLGKWGCDAEFKCIGSDINGGLKLTAGWPSGHKYTLIHMTRYAGGHRGRIWNNVSAESVNWLSGHHDGCIGRSYHNGWIMNACSKKNVHNWTLVSDQFNYTRVEQAGGATTSRKIKNREYMHPVNGIGINGWSHPWDNGNERSGFEVAEVMVFDKILTQAQLRSIEKYMQSKYGFMKG
jgi:hypothetical protein